SGKLKIFLRFALLAVIAVAGGSLFFTARKGVEANLVALLGDASGDGLQEAASAMSNSAKFLVKVDSADAARARLTELGVELPPSGAEQRMLKALTPYAHGFLSPSTRRLLEKGEYAAVRDAAAARLFSPVPPVISPQKDPFLLFTDYVLSSEAPHGEWVAVGVDLTPEQALAALSAVKGADDVRCAGAPFHTAIASANSKKEINVLSAISLFCVLLFGWMLTRSFRFIPVLVLALASSFCVSSAALFAFFEKPHAIAFVFGTTLIGMSVDYVYHSMMAKCSIAKPLSMSYLSTVACFLPLLFSKVEVLNQMAIFTVAGLTTVFIGVLSFGRGRGDERRCIGDERREVRDERRAMSFSSRVAAMLAFLWWVIILQFDIPFFSTKMDMSRLYRPDPYLAEGECIALEMSGGSGFVPSAKEQGRNFRLVERLFEAEGKNYCEMTGLPLSVLKLPAKGRVFAPREHLETALYRWNLEARSLLLRVMLAIATVFVVVLRRSSLAFILPMLCTYSVVESVLLLMEETMNFFATICFFIFMGLGLDYCVFRRHMLKSGNGDADSKSTACAVFYSFLTSFIGFGLLAFTDFAVTRVMGITLAAGLATFYITAKLFSGCVWFPSRHGKKQDDSSAVWHEQREQCASLFWARFMWYSYAWFGKNFQKVIFVIGMPVIYLFSLQGRVALKKFYAVLSEFSGKEIRATMPRLFMHILRFSWGLMDKTDSCTLGKNPPRMSVRDDEGWRTFRETVNSGKGAFVMCTHLGMIGVLPSLPDALKRNGESGMRIPKVNAFQQMGHDAVFMKVFMQHFDDTRLQLHAVEDIGVETAVRMKDAIGRGELVIMAGDRVSAGSRSVLKHRFMGRDCVWPKGVYRFAKLMESPVFAVTCVSTGWNRYEVHFAVLEQEPSAMLDGFVSFLERETLAYPGQWYQFYDFFSE
ncbi:MAG: MMPL family transporter, partial [Kiritimatiellae bacterium]|nr:MMPL family transporter [Kiritimatiellia bacterium]